MKAGPSVRVVSDRHLTLPSPPDWGGEREPIPLSAINQYLFCPRRAALIHIEGVFKDNEHTLCGNIVHQHSDLAGYEVAKGVTVLRALPVWCERLGLSGKCDLVERRCDGALYPVEFKLGKRRRWENDDAQLCAQALCLEEMFGIPVPRGAIFHASSKRRREVVFTPELRALTERVIADLHALFLESEIANRRSELPRLPPVVWKPACAECSLYETCMPRASVGKDRAERLARAIFQI